MNGAEAVATVKDVGGSQLSTFARWRLLIYNPRDAFSLFSREEFKRDAIAILILHLALRTPVYIQKAHVTGQLERVGLTRLPDLLLAIAGGLLLSLVLFLVSVVLLRVLLRIFSGVQASLADMAITLALCHAPTLLLVFELPGFVWHFNDLEAFKGLVVVRGVVAVLSLRMIYWGLRTRFSVSKRMALGVIFAPLLLMIAAIIVAGAMAVQF